MMQSSPFTPRRIFILIVRLVLAGIFLFAGYSKLFFPNRLFSSWFMIKFSVSSNLSNFALQVAAYKLLSPAAVDFVAHTLPFAEIALGLLLLIGYGLRIWASLVTSIMVGFWIVVTRAYLLHMDINCGCFSTPEPLTIKTVIRDGVLVALAILMTAFTFIEARKPHPWSTPEKASA
jgi:uncharacterized membrane protein YphA (DoxX/SURF4 family)